MIRFPAADVEVGMKIKNTCRLLIILSLTVAYVGCSDESPVPKIQPPETTGFGNVSGIITDAATGDPIPGHRCLYWVSEWKQVVTEGMCSRAFSIQTL